MRFIRLLLALAAGLLAGLLTPPAASAATTTLPKIQAYMVTG